MDGVVEINLSDEQEMLRETAARMAMAHDPGAFSDGELKRNGEQLWATLSQAGLLSLTVPLNRGGMGASAIEACLVASELGAVVAPVPFLEQAVLAPQILHL